MRVKEADKAVARAGKPCVHDSTRKENKAGGAHSSASVAARSRRTAGRSSMNRRKVTNVAVSKDGRYMYHNRSLTHAACQCFEKMQVCSLCQLR
jgi:hypothetical protein